eukprot:4267632-Alexandrium_andersonii.AAC.1
MATRAVASPRCPPAMPESESRPARPGLGATGPGGLSRTGRRGLSLGGLSRVTKGTAGRNA